MKKSNLQWKWALTALLMGTMLTACDNKKFTVEGNITNAKDSTLYFENISLNGPVAVDSVKLGADGAFSFSEKAPEAPEFYRLRIGQQIVNVSIDSTETVSVKAQWPQMANEYEVSGSENCNRIKSLSQLQMQLQQHVNSIMRSPNLGYDAANDSIIRVMEAYKQIIKNDYIYKEPMQASSYFALFQTLNLGNANVLIFNPRASEEDVKVFAAVATSWDTFHPGAERGKNLHNIAIAGMKDVRIVRNKQAQAIDESKVNTSGVLDIALPDNQGNIRRLTELQGKVVLLDFHLFADEQSMKRIMWLREIYNKYHNQGLEIYQVSIDPDEHFWKTQTEALPWVCVREADPQSSSTIVSYNVQSIPTFYLLNRSGSVVRRDLQIKDIDAEIKALL